MRERLFLATKITIFFKLKNVKNFRNCRKIWAKLKRSRNIKIFQNKKIDRNSNLFW